MSIINRPSNPVARDIARDLNAGFAGKGVTRDDIKSVVDRLSGLSGAEAGTVLKQLKAAGKLDNLVREINDGKSGLTASEKQAFFADMASKLGGKDLARLHKALAANGKSGDAAAFAQAVATHASPQAKLDFVTKVAPRAANGGDAAARALGTVLGSMEGAWARAAFEAADVKGFMGGNALRHAARELSEVKIDRPGIFNDRTTHTLTPDLARFVGAAISAGYGL